MFKDLTKRMQKTVREWSAVLPRKKFKDAVHSLFLEQRNDKDGTDYFTWHKTPKIQKDFEKFFSTLMRGKTKYYHISTDCDDRFFVTGTLHKGGRSRSSVVFEYLAVNEDGHIVHNYSGTSYNGFGRVENSIQQELVIDVNTETVLEFNDSEHRDEGSGMHNLSKEFMDDVLDKEAPKKKTI